MREKEEKGEKGGGDVAERPQLLVVKARGSLPPPSCTFESLQCI